MIVSKVHVFVQNTVFSPRSARFLNSALGASFYSDYQQSAPVCTKQSFKPDFGTFSHCRTGHTTFERFSEKCTSLWKTAFSARDLDVSPFSHWVHHFLGIFSKINVFVQNTVFSPRSARFLNSALGVSFYSDYQQSAPVCTKQSFKPDFGTFSHCRTGHTTFERFSEKCTSLWKTAFSARDLDVSPFSHWVHHFLGIFSKINVFVQNTVFSPRSARFLNSLGVSTALGVHHTKQSFNSALGASFYSDYQQSAPVCTKQSFKPDFGTFSHCRTGHTTFERFSEKCTSLWKTAFSARDLDVSPFSHWVHHFLGIFSKIN